MKLCIVLFLIAGAFADLPRFRPARFRSQRQELAPTTTETVIESTTDFTGYQPSGWKPSGEPFTLSQENLSPTDTYGPPAPYPPSGWKPAGQPFTLPQEQNPPATNYGVPDNSYALPTTDASTTENPQAENLEDTVNVQKSVGTYYVLLPNGELQRVEFLTENDIQKMQYTARLQLSERAPLYVFGP